MIVIDSQSVTQLLELALWFVQKTPLYWMVGPFMVVSLMGFFTAQIMKLFR